MANKKWLDPDLHGTKNRKTHVKHGLTGRVVKGEGFSKKANMYYSYTNFNAEGKTNIIEWKI